MTGELPFDDGNSNSNSTSNGIEAELATGDYHAGQRFHGVDFSALPLADHTFEDCVFESCRFAERDLARVAFISCVFSSSEFVLVKLENATLNAVSFRGSKLIGVNFSGVNKFGFLPDFEDCLLESSVFCLNSLKKARFLKTKVKNCDFIECDLREADFNGSSLELSVFQKCTVERADFRFAFDYAIDPATNRLSRARFRLPEAQSFLGFLGIEID